ncbi:MAG: DUF6701 domain-containing protein [Pseudohongiellaceae bacterium]
MAWHCPGCSGNCSRRGIADYVEIPNGSYDDNPRATAEFGTYRGHDRVRSWREIYIGPSTP